MMNGNERPYIGYWMYESLLQKGYIEVRTKDITKENWQMHYDAVLNVIRDYIETDYLRVPCIVVIFDNGHRISLGLADYWYNIIMWYLIVIPCNDEFGSNIEPDNLFFPLNGMTRGSIKSYIDDQFIDKYRSLISNIEMNNIVDECMYSFLVIDEFSFYIANSINLEQCFIQPMMRDKDFYDIVNLDLTDVSLADAKNVAVKATDRLVSKIMQDDGNPLNDYFVAKESIRKNQFREVAVSIAQKPDGHGSIYPVKITTNLITGGVNDLVHYYIESSTGRTAQNVLKYNVGNAGHQARLLGLNNMDTNLHPDPNYVCNTRNLIKIKLDSLKEVSRYAGRYYRLTPDGRDMKIRKGDKSVIGKYIYLRSPITCASKEHGGVCYRCYGDLSYTNSDINIGKFAAEAISSALTQKMLSAKHLLEPNIKPFEWSDGFKKFFDTDSNIVILKDMPINYSKYYMELDRELIFFETESEDDDTEYNKSIDSFLIVGPNGEEYDISSKSNASLYFTEEFEAILQPILISAMDDIDNSTIRIPLSKIEDMSIFGVNILNNDLSDSLNKFNRIIDKINVTDKYTIEEIMDVLNHTLDEIGIHVASVHMEVVISNQVIVPDDPLSTPNWEYKNVGYSITTLKRSLDYNPSITKTLSYQDVNRTLTIPLTYQKHKSSVMDLFFMEKPQEFLSDDLLK